MKRVLIIPSGTELGLEVHDALVRRRDLQLFGAESTENSHASYVFRDNFIVPDYRDPNFLSAIEILVDRHRLDAIFPAHDDVQTSLLDAGHELQAKLISSPRQTVLITRFKSRSYEAMKNVVPVPKLFATHRVAPSDFPVFVKPDRGQGSQDTYLCSSQSELDDALRRRDDMLVCEFLPGREVTVDCFSDRAQGLLFAGARLRRRIRAGISVRAESFEIAEADLYARKINAQLQFFGPWFFQIKERRPNEWVLLEIGARLPGGTTFQRARGINLPLLALFEHDRAPIEIASSPRALTMDRAFVSRFRYVLDFESLYIDFDDTLCLKGEPNPELVGLIALARHRGKRIVLISRNDGSCRGWLESTGLTALFHEIILLNRETPKAQHIGRRSVLIDDSFAEREACASDGVACFDVDAVRSITEQLLRG